MNKIKTIILTLIFTTATTLFGYNSSILSNNSSNTYIEATANAYASDITFEVKNIEDKNDVSENIENVSLNNAKPTNTTSNKEETHKTKQETITEAENSKTENTETKNTNTENKNSSTYKSKSGYSITFPDTWDGKYSVQENGDELTVVFKSSESNKIDYEPWLFAVKKADSSESPYEHRNFNHFSVGNDEYIAYGPSSATLSDKVEDYDKYLQMGDMETQNIAKSIVVNK